MRRLFLLALVPLAAGCAGTMAPGSPLTGRWGGEHVGVTLTPGGGRVEYDCASGSIDQPVMPAADGRFAASGTHVPGQGGPAQVGYTPPSHPARYSGRVSGDVMDIEVDVPALGTKLGPYRLRRGAEPTIFRCL